MPRKKKAPNILDSLNEPLVVVALAIALGFVFLPWVWKIFLLLILLAVLAVYWTIHTYKLNKRRKLGMPLIHAMEPIPFEERLWLLFRDLGYKAETTPASGDWGADLVVRKDGILTVVQAKHYKNPVGVEAIQQVFTSRAHYLASQAIVVTNSTFTRAAKQLAEKSNVELWDGARLEQELARANKINHII